MPSNRTGKVASVISQYRVVLNVGTDDGVQLGDDFILYRITDEIFDPDTGESLGEYEEVIGRGTVTHAQQRICTLESSETKDTGRKVIKRYRSNSYASLFASLSPSEVVEEEPERQARPFSHAQVGDYARPT